jgi:hypothetical protein
MRLFAGQFRLMNSFGFGLNEYTQKQVQVRILEIAEALHRQAQAGTVPGDLEHICLKDPLHRTTAGLAKFLKPIYGHYKRNLCEHRKLEYLFGLYEGELVCIALGQPAAMERD